jgi:hypothetical protein
VHSHSSRGSSLPLALTFHVPMKQWAYVCMLSSSIGIGKRQQQEDIRLRTHSRKPRTSHRVMHVQQVDTYTAILRKFRLTLSDLLKNPRVTDAADGFPIPDPTIDRFFIRRTCAQWHIVDRSECCFLLFRCGEECHGTRWLLL